MRLVSGAPYWLLHNALDERAVQPPSDCDVAIVGAGLTGALLADALTAAGFTVTILDRRTIGEASTAACTGLLSYELDVDLIDLSERIGLEHAVRAFSLCADGIDWLAALAATLPDNAGFARTSGVYLGTRSRDRNHLQREASLRVRCGLDAEFRTAAQTKAAYGFPGYGSLYTPQAGVIDPVRLTRGLIRRAESGGGVVCVRTALRNWESSPSGVNVDTDRGTFRAKWIVFATGYETPEPLSGVVKLHSSYALVTEPAAQAPPWEDECILWEARRPYFYLRRTADHRLMIGGLDSPFRNSLWRDEALPRKVRRLETRLCELVPGAVAETGFAWAGTFGETADGLPYIGPHAGLPRALFALGYGGNGIVFSMIASRILRDICLGEGHPDAALFAFDRWDDRAGHAN
jgi:glycine/D-amino acid oxidase-like deaminating enzyme